LAADQAKQSSSGEAATPVSATAAVLLSLSIACETPMQMKSCSSLKDKGSGKRSRGKQQHW
jgi:hypothetical protein